MARAKQPVTVGGIEFDALIESEEKLSAEVPSYPVEEGYKVSDSIILNQKELSMTLFVTDTPVTWRSRHGGNGRVDQIVQRLKELYYKKDTTTVVTSSETYDDMAIANISFRKTTEVGYAMEIPIDLVQISKTSTATTTIPDSYGKSGETGATAGAASTSDDSGSASTKSFLASVVDTGKGLLGL